MVLVEAQSTWTSNIIIRGLEYLVNSYRRYFINNNIDLYKNRKVRLPRPELYVIYTGNRKKKPEVITLTDEFFRGEKAAVEVIVKMIYDGNRGDIINQYITFTKVIDEQVKIYGRTKQAVLEAIRICKNEYVLKEYLENRESEVVDIMMQLYDKEEIMRVHDIGIAIRTMVEVYQEVGCSFKEVVEKIAAKYSMSKEVVEDEVKEYWKE